MSSPHYATSDPRIGTMVLGRYRLVRYLAAGGMGAIYLARAEGAAGFVRPVVIKRSLRVGDDQAGRMFAREARILSQLRHPGIVSIHDFAEDDGDYVMVLDYVHGFTLSDWAKYLRRSQRVLPVDVAVHVMLRVLEALQYAHTLRDRSGELLGVVHRDIKPSNVLIDVQGDVKLADFGIARTETEVTEVSVSDSTLKGTFPYMAPELFSRAKPNAATDVYSAAVTLYALLSGSNPFSSADVAITVGRVLGHEPALLQMIRGDVPDPLGEAIAVGMSKEPALRYTSAEAFAAALRASGVVDGDMDARFRTAVAVDFGDPSFAELLGVSSLSERAEAWSQQAGPGERGLLLPLPAPDPTMQGTIDAVAVSRTALDGEGATVGDATRIDDATAAARPTALGRDAAEPELHAPDITEPVPMRPRRGVGVVIAIAAGLGAIAAMLWYLRSRGATAPAEPTVVVVRGDVAMEGAPAAPPAAPSPATRGIAPAQVPDRAPPEERRDAAGDRRDAPAQPRDRDLTQAVRRRQRLITACVERYPDGVPATSELSFRFQVDRSGRVARVELLPEELAPTPLGECLLGVARATKFGARDEPVTFRIPITVRQK